jgi:alkylation response protein AidB-like acyl-CoA dehydrogenase
MVASEAVQIHGANGCINSNPVERYYRDAKINEIIEGSNEIHEKLISVNSYMGN